MSDDPYLIRRLALEDVGAYVSFRETMLLAAPDSFASSPGDDPAGTVSQLREQLAKSDNAIIGAFRGEALVGSAGVLRLPRQKMSHMARIWGVFVRPEDRSRGVGARVVRAAIELARTWPGVSAINLSVSEQAGNARRLYEGLGFVAWGVEPRALRFGGRTLDEVHMQLSLDPGP